MNRRNRLIAEAPPVTRLWAACTIVGCTNGQTTWAIDRPTLDRVLTHQGWVKTSAGWVCRQHVAMYRALAELATAPETSAP